MPTMLQERDDLITQAREIAEFAKAAGRDMNPGEVSLVNSKPDRIRALNGKIAEAKEGEDILARLGELDASGAHPGGNGPQFLDLSPAGIKRMAVGIAERMVEGQSGRKAIIPSGETFFSVPTLPASPVRMGVVTNGFLATLGVTKISAGANARYLRQTTRTNNASAVPPNTEKPESQYGLTPIDVALRVYAHLSEPQDRFMLEDATELATFLATEMVYGLFESVETDCLVGEGGDAITGILATSGIRTVPFSVDIPTTTRRALAQAQSLGYAFSPVFVLNPDDAATVDLTKTTGSGSYVLDGAPQNVPTPSLWGVPLVVANGMPAGSGLLFDRQALALYTDSKGVRVDWDPAASGFKNNTITARCEGRFDLGVLQPAAAAMIHTAEEVTP